jgi:hypothetical protein
MSSWHMLVSWFAGQIHQTHNSMPRCNTTALVPSTAQLKQ